MAPTRPKLRDLNAAGVTKIFQEQLSSVDAQRPQLAAAVDFAREGDVIICTRLDRLARSLPDIIKIEERLAAKKVAIKILNPAIDTATPNGRLMFNVIASVAQFEREIMLERQREGIAKAKRDGKYKGRQPTARAKSAEVLELLQTGLQPAQVAKKTGISRRSVFRIRDDTKK